MREYRYQATDATIEALRQLKAPWSAARLSRQSLLVVTNDGVTIRVAPERIDIEPSLEAIRLRADVVPAGVEDMLVAGVGDDAGEPFDVGDLGAGRNDVVLFTGETWAEAAPASDGNGTTPVAAQTMQFHGRAGQRPATADVVCTTTDAIVVAAATGEGLLVRLGVKPLSLEAVTDRATIARFLVQRGYAGE